MPHSKTGLAHAVFFTLKDPTPAAREALVAACDKYLTDHPGVIHYSAGIRETSYQRPVNDQEFDVALVVVFDSKQAHDDYQVAPRHKEFIAEQSPNWAKVRVFDALA
jgi:hypothetical protein